MTLLATTEEFLFSFHGLGLRYSTSSQAFLSPVSTFLAHFRQDRLQSAPALEIHFDEVACRADVPVRWSPTARRLFSGTRPSLGDAMRSLWQCDVVQDGTRLIIDLHDQGVLEIDGLQGRATGYIIRPDAMHPDVRESFFHYVLAELLKRRNLFTLHATAVEYGGRGVLIPGYSGRGKTTAFLSLLRAGFRYLSDDHPLLREEGGRLELLAFPMKIDVTEHSVKFFPELRTAAPGILKQGVYKKFFQAEDLFPNSIGRSCEPAMILFPQVSDMPHSCLEPLSKSRALEAIMPQAMLVYDQEVAAREFRMLSKLIQQVACYRLHFGRDILDLPNLIAPLLERSHAA